MKLDDGLIAYIGKTKMIEIFYLQLKKLIASTEKSNLGAKKFEIIPYSVVVNKRHSLH